jgi:hypothetical protein
MDNTRTCAGEGAGVKADGWGRLGGTLKGALSGTIGEGAGGGEANVLGTLHFQGFGHPTGGRACVCEGVVVVGRVGEEVCV